MTEYWYSRWVFERALAAIYLVAFIAAATQFVPLLGARPEPAGRRVQQAVPRVTERVPISTDSVSGACAWLGVWPLARAQFVPAAHVPLGGGRGLGAAVAAVPVLRQHRPDILRIRMGNPAV
jgi:hypothetical protein